MTSNPWPEHEEWAETLPATDRAPFEISMANVSSALYRKTEEHANLDDAVNRAIEVAKDWEVVSIWEPMNVKPVARWVKGKPVRLLT